MPTISDHLLDSNCSVDFDHFNITTSDPNKFKYLTAEILLKKRDLIRLSKSIKSIPSKATLRRHLHVLSHRTQPCYSGNSETDKGVLEKG